jgi:hypothetical protein
MSSLNKPIRVEFQTTTNHMSTEQISTLKKDGEELLNKIKKTKETNNDGDLKKSTVKDASISLSQKHSLIGHMGKVLFGMPSLLIKFMRFHSRHFG